MMCSVMKRLQTSSKVYVIAMKSFTNSSSRRYVKLFTMQDPDFAPSSATTTTTAATENPIQIHFSDLQMVPETRSLSDLLRERTQRKEIFFGIEVVAHTTEKSQPFVLDYNDFGPTLMPLFTSLVWLGETYASVDNLQDVESLRVAAALQPRVIAVPHFSCYRADHKRVADFCRLNFANVIAVRGNAVEPEQPMQHAVDLIREIRKLRGDTITIGAAAYPETHVESLSLKEEMKFLLEKIEAGADFIVTQVSFSAKAVIEFVRKCRSNGITIPIVVGVFVPTSFRALEGMCSIAEVRVPGREMLGYKIRARRDIHTFQEHAEAHTARMLNEILDSNLDVYGFQFYTVNCCKNIRHVMESVLEVQRQKRPPKIE